MGSNVWGAPRGWSLRDGDGPSPVVRAGVEADGVYSVVADVAGHGDPDVDGYEADGDYALRYERGAYGSVLVVDDLVVPVVGERADGPAEAGGAGGADAADEAYVVAGEPPSVGDPVDGGGGPVAAADYASVAGEALVGGG